MSIHTIKVILFLCATGLLGKGYTQNLVPNPGFENINWNCSGVLRSGTSINTITDWFSPVEGGSADAFHDKYAELCKTNLSCHPSQLENIKTLEKPKSGTGFVGFVICSKLNTREYIQVKLIRPLEAGNEYQISFYALQERKGATHISSSIGALFSVDTISGNRGNIFDVHPQFANFKTNFIIPGKWKKLFGQFIAKGGEQFLTIGNFLNKKNSIIKERQNGNGDYRAIYVYIDDVSLIKIGPKQKTNSFTELIKTGKIDLHNLLFETGSATIDTGSYHILKELELILVKHNELKIEIIGHTDNEGDIKDNNKLSLDRANSIGTWLINRNINSSRITYAGKGASQPIVSNSTAIGKQKNRRVEIQIIDN